MTTHNEIYKHELQNVRLFYLKAPALFRKIAITDNQIDIVNYINNVDGCTSKDVADYKKISIYSAATQLKVLCDIGYLVRKKRFQKSGGKIYFYRCAF